MSTTIPVTIRLDPVEYEYLRAEATRRGLPPYELAGEYVRVRLNGQSESAEERKRRGLAALDRLAALTADLPPIDAVQIARDGREELEQRPF